MENGRIGKPEDLIGMAVFLGTKYIVALTYQYQMDEGMRGYG